MHVGAISIYPVKSCAGIDVASWPLERHGLWTDRTWMVVDRDGRFLTQREYPAMAVVRTAIAEDRLILTTPVGSASVPIRPAGSSGRRAVTVWGYTGEALDCGDTAAALLSEHLGVVCRLVRAAPEHDRHADAGVAGHGVPVAFADGYPLLLIGRTSLDALNARLDEPLPMNRFRPNIVVDGADPFAEDRWSRITIGAVPVDVVSPCTRCRITTVDQQTGRRDGAEPLRALGRFRRGTRGERGVLFGQNAVHRALGRLTVGDAVVPWTLR